MREQLTVTANVRYKAIESDCRLFPVHWSLSLLRAQERKQDHIAYRRPVGEQHDEPVDADSRAGSGRQAVLEGTDVIGIVVHGLRMACLFLPRLFSKSRSLVFRIVQLGETIGNFAAADVELEALRHPRVLVAAAGERRHLDGVIQYERRLDQLLFHRILEKRELQASDTVFRAVAQAERFEPVDKGLAIMKEALRYIGGTPLVGCGH